MKLYILKQNGIVKIGITKNDDIYIRLKEINKNLSYSNHFELVRSFEMNSSPEIVEKLIHNYLGINQLGLKYLHDNLVIVDLECITKKTSGYTETFLSDVEKVKGVILLFGLCGYINISNEDILKLECINGMSFDNLIKSHSKFMELSKNAIFNDCSANNNYSLITSLEKISNKIINTTITVDFTVEGKDYYLIFDNEKIKVDNIASSKNRSFLTNIINHKENLIVNMKSSHVLISLIASIEKENPHLSKGKFSLSKSIKKEERIKEYKYTLKTHHSAILKIFRFMDEACYFDGGQGCGWAQDIFYNELGLTNGYSEDGGHLLYHSHQLLYGNTNTSEKKFLKFQNYIERDAISIDNLFDKDWDKMRFCKNYYNLAKNYASVVFKSNNIETNELLGSVDLASNFFKAIFQSNNKEKTIKLLGELVELLDLYYFQNITHTEPISNKQYSFYFQVQDRIINILEEDKYLIGFTKSYIKLNGNSFKQNMTSNKFGF